MDVDLYATLAFAKFALRIWNSRQEVAHANDDRFVDRFGATGFSPLLNLAAFSTALSTSRDRRRLTLAGERCNLDWITILRKYEHYS